MKRGLPSCGFACADGQALIRIRKTAKGKKVTVLAGLVGDRAKAVTNLKHLLGVGGEISKEDFSAIELQGDQTKRLEAILQTIGALPKKVSLELKVEQPRKEAKKRLVPEPIVSGPVSKACLLVHGTFWPYCNGACSFCPPLTDVFEGLEMFCDWYEEPAPKRRSSVGGAMNQTELDDAFELLGLRASVGSAVEQKMPILSVPKKCKSVLPIEEVRVRIEKPPIRVEKPSRPVRVILNSPPVIEWINFPSVEIRLMDEVAGWMSDYQSFVISVLEDLVPIMHQEMEDSRKLNIWFSSRNERDTCVTILNEVMPAFFKMVQYDTQDEIVVKDDEEGLVDLFVFQRLAADLGVDGKEEFWEKFCEGIDNCDGSEAAIHRAFEEAVIAVTTEDTELETEGVVGFYDDLPTFDALGAPPPPTYFP